ncbi:MAG: response regulator [Candidatus Latescibacteria bacterium]|nr:response regulator [Candidatus Latescibacterota bacterium]
MARILVVDDEETNRDLLRDLLQTEGHEIILAENGQQGVVAYQQNRPQLVITDILMPEMDGLELIKQIRAIAPDQYIIALAAAGNIALEQALEAGANEGLDKPFHIQHLLEKVQAALNL